MYIIAKLKYHNFDYELFLGFRIRVFEIQKKEGLTFRQTLPVSQKK
jgi:hypothetical protein